MTMRENSKMDTIQKSNIRISGISLSNAFDKVSNDTYMFDINWGYVKELAKTDWQKEIAQYFIDEYGTEDRNYWLCW